MVDCSRKNFLIKLGVFKKKGAKSLQIKKKFVPLLHRNKEISITLINKNMERKTKIQVKFENMGNETKSIKLEVNSIGFINIVEEVYESEKVSRILEKGYYITGVNILTL